MGVTAFLLAAVPYAAADGGAADRATAEKRAADVRLPAAGEAALSRVVIRSAPRRNARRIGVMERLRFDYRPRIFFVIQARAGREGKGDGGGPVWLRIRVPAARTAEPAGCRRARCAASVTSGARSWSSTAASARSASSTVAATSARLRPSRRPPRSAPLLLRAPLAVGKPGAPTPLGSFT
ncbi:MAG: hypothetical protein U0R24_00180 [Solirubrobacterales bacterium]